MIVRGRKKEDIVSSRDFDPSAETIQKFKEKEGKEPKFFGRGRQK